MKTHGASPGRMINIPRIAVAIVLYTTFIYFALSRLNDNNHPTITPAHKRALDLLASDQGQMIMDNLHKISEKIAEEESSEQREEPQPKEPDYSGILRNTDPHHTRAHVRFWQTLSPSAIETYQNDWQNFVTDLPPYSDYAHRYEGTGIVFTAGNKDTLNRTMTVIKVMRDYGCRLPVEVWHLDDETPSTDEMEELMILNAASKVLSDDNLVRPVQKKRHAEKQ